MTDSKKKKAAGTAGAAKGKARPGTAATPSDGTNPEATEDSSLGQRGREAAGTARDALKDRVEATAEWSRDRAEGAQRTAGRSAQKIRRGATDVGRRAKGVFDDYPLALGVLAFAGGFMLGTVLPRTAPENRYVGPLRDDLRERGLRESERFARQAREYAEDTLAGD